MGKKILYWAFEGNEGTGKTVLSKAFAEQIGAIWTYEPNAETEELKTLRDLSLDKTKNMTKYARELCLLASRHIHHETSVTPLLKNSSSLVTDRSFLSGMVYAKIKSFDFDEWLDLSVRAHIKTYPDMIIYCKSNKRKMVKNKEGRANDIYDTADDSVISSIDLIYDEAIEFIKESKHTKHIKVLTFNNDFNHSVQHNLNMLIASIKESIS